MHTTPRLLAALGGLLALMLVGQAHGSNINKGIDIADGEQSGSQSSINGSISVGRNATVTGTLETVNGAIRVDEGARVQGLNTVNGSIRISQGASTGDISGVNGSIHLDENVTVQGGIDVVNGKIALQKGTRVEQGVSNVNGEFELVACEIGGDLSTVNGDVLLTDDAIVHGDLVVEKPGGWSWTQHRKPRIVIGRGAQVLGELRLEREVELYLHDTAKVGGVSGAMSLDDAVRFSGDRP